MTLPLQMRRTLTAVVLALAVVMAGCSSKTATPPPSPTAEPTAVSTPVTAPTLVPTATLRPSPTPSPTPQPSPTATVAPTPTATATRIPLPTPTPTPSPTPTQTPLPTPDPRYGLIVTSDDARAREVFGVVDYIDYSSNLTDVPPGSRKILYIPSVNPVPTQRIMIAAAQAPGSIWYVLGEPNAHGSTVEDVLVGLHDTYAAIKQADPSALITSPSILNFSFTCINCGGYQHGGRWIHNFRAQYFDLYAEEPPIDIWAIDVFPLVWPATELPASEAFPTVRDDLVVRQVRDFRSWIDEREFSQGKPIWVTEFGLHWGFSDWVSGVPGCKTPSPVGEYLTAEVIAYLERVYTWFEANANTMNIERWFTYSTYKNIEVCQGDSGNGLSMLDSPGVSGALTDVGKFYNDWIRGIR